VSIGVICELCTFVSGTGCRDLRGDRLAEQGSAAFALIDDDPAEVHVAADGCEEAEQREGQRGCWLRGRCLRRLFGIGR
jgi:hypothetical protein